MPTADIRKVQKELRLITSQSTSYLGSDQVRFVAMDEKQCEYFSICHIYPTRGNNLPGIPMYHPELYKLEDENEVKCDSVSLTFMNPKGTVQNSFGYMSLPKCADYDPNLDAATFDEVYRREKGIWLDLIKGKDPKNRSIISREDMIPMS